MCKVLLGSFRFYLVWLTYRLGEGKWSFTASAIILHTSSSILTNEFHSPD